MKNSNAMVEVLIRWAGDLPKDGYDILERKTGKWHPVPTEDTAQFLHDGGIVHLNPSEGAIAQYLRG